MDGIDWKEKIDTNDDGDDERCSECGKQLVKTRAIDTNGTHVGDTRVVDSRLYCFDCNPINS